MSTGQGARVLIIDDELQIRRLLNVALQAHEYEVVQAETGIQGLEKASTCLPDLILLDLGLPDLSGLEVMERLREWTTVPIIVLTAKEREETKIEMLNGGADDYVTKPFGMGELIARIRVALRHAARTAQEPVLQFEGLTLDLAHRHVELGGKRIKLTPTEYDLLKVLALNAGRVMTQRQLLQQVWGKHHYEAESHYLRIYVGHLRKKLEQDSTRPQYIVTEPGIGYRFMEKKHSD
ncbi:response regulator [Paenibacillus sp. F411]|uniref:response regulator n=1 Tax=Paenibacillus sp. F411 TaxID=2820239 RepID=UPI001AAF746E|nr:response regulator [Paenibacillus sp. F411]MBO2944587.1 response regulator [Paenibacillus sp. F411]